MVEGEILTKFANSRSWRQIDYLFIGVGFAGQPYWSKENAA
jgi:hypothetical protein